MLKVRFFFLENEFFGGRYGRNSSSAHYSITQIASEKVRMGFRTALTPILGANHTWDFVGIKLSQERECGSERDKTTAACVR